MAKEIWKYCVIPSFFVAGLFRAFTKLCVLKQPQSLKQHLELLDHCLIDPKNTHFGKF
jgi:hypothetical protein